MKIIISLVVGLIAGIALAGIAGWMVMPGMMLEERQSPLSVDDTVEKISANAESMDWVVSDIKKLHKSVKKHGGGELPPVVLVNLCQPHHAFKILNEDGNKKVSVFMPCTISVYQKSDGKTYICSMNAGLLGRMFGGTVAEVMGGAVAEDQQKFIAFAR